MADQSTQLFACRGIPQVDDFVGPSRRQHHSLPGKSDTCGLFFFIPEALVRLDVTVYVPDTEALGVLRDSDGFAIRCEGNPGGVAYIGERCEHLSAGHVEQGNWPPDIRNQHFPIGGEGESESDARLTEAAQLLAGGCIPQAQSATRSGTSDRLSIRRIYRLVVEISLSETDRTKPRYRSFRQRIPVAICVWLLFTVRRF